MCRLQASADRAPSKSYRVLTFSRVIFYGCERFFEARTADCMLLCRPNHGSRIDRGLLDLIWIGSLKQHSARGKRNNQADQQNFTEEQ